ncbi:hypothetical protein C8034_v003296 [Colletotrichum sidae]|uniref:Uncharacterized protein n=1 Tax=Colletotrichum sidae TaxID=1347389 RepID=A0A4R8TAA0_9PEZI|nr:hypothetical protein C8034_v003296 [Colletotrichum sidae]
MAPTPLHETTVALHLNYFSRRDEDKGRIAGLLVGCLLGGIVAVAIIYLCFNCAFTPKNKPKDIEKRNGIDIITMSMDLTTSTVPMHRIYIVYRMVITAITRTTLLILMSRQKAKKKSKSSKRASRSRSRGSYLGFVPMPPMQPIPINGMPMPVHPAPVFGVGMGPPGGDDFIDYGPAPDPGLMDLEMGWGVDPGLLIQVDEPGGGREARGDDCCHAFFDAICGGAPRRRRRDRRRHAAVVVEEEMLAD